MRWRDARRAMFLAAVAAAVLSAAASPGEAAGPKAPAPGASAGAPETVDLNAATSAELQAVPGIGKVLADRIVEFREKNGPFGRVDDLIKVQGIGEKSLEKLRPYLTASQPRGK